MIIFQNNQILQQPWFKWDKEQSLLAVDLGITHVIYLQYTGIMRYRDFN